MLSNFVSKIMRRFLVARHVLNTGFFVLFLFLATCVLALIDEASFSSGQSLFQGIFTIVTFVPYLAVTTRRLHDIDKSGWWVLTICIPIIFILLTCMKGGRMVEGSNSYGPDPLA